MRLLINDSKSPKVKKTIQTTFVIKKGYGFYPRSMLNIIQPGPPGIVVYQDHYRGHYKKKNSCPCNDAIKTQPLDHDDAF
jgi:hypothetical protein